MKIKKSCQGVPRLKVNIPYKFIILNQKKNWKFCMGSMNKRWESNQKFSVQRSHKTVLCVCIRNANENDILPESNFSIYKHICNMTNHFDFRDAFDIFMNRIHVNIKVVVLCSLKTPYWAYFSCDSFSGKILSNSFRT